MTSEKAKKYCEERLLLHQLILTYPQLIIAVRAVQKYDECRFVWNYLFSPERIRQIFVYVWARFISGVAGMASAQVPAVLVNKYLGPQYNAAMTIGNSVATHALTLSSSLSTALWPAVANKAGEGDEAGVKRLSFMACRLSALLIMVFAIPLALEVKEILRIWLVNPPSYSAEICIAVLIREVIDKSTDGYWMAILGLGRGVVKYSWSVCWAGFGYVVCAWILFALGKGMASVCFGLIIYALLISASRLYIGRTLVAFPIRHWLRHVCLPLWGVSAVTLVGGKAVACLFDPSIQRIFITGFVCELIFVPASWFLIMGESERNMMREKLGKILPATVAQRFNKNKRV